jgi:hypothetical protein
MIGDSDCGEIGGMKIGKGNGSTRRKPDLAQKPDESKFQMRDMRPAGGIKSEIVIVGGGGSSIGSTRHCGHQ